MTEEYADAVMDRIDDEDAGEKDPFLDEDENKSNHEKFSELLYGLDKELHEQLAHELDR